MRNFAMRGIALPALLLAGFAAQAASIQIFKQPNFTGAELTLYGATGNLARAGFQDQASSLVLDGRWEVCTQPNYQGDCRVLAPGRYATLDRVLNHRIESARPLVDRQAAADERWRGEWRDRHARGEMELFPGADFRGRPLRVDRDADTLEEMGSRASSLLIHEGTWQLCTRPNHEGYCRNFEPGRYASLGRFDNNVASAKLIR